MSVELLLAPLLIPGFHFEVISCALLIWVFSWLWHDHIVVRPWLNWTGMTLEQAQALHKGRLVQDLSYYLISKLALSYACLLLATWLGIAELSEALSLCLLLGFGMVLPAGLGPVIFEGRSIGLWCLSSVLTIISIAMILFLPFLFALLPISDITSCSTLCSLWTVI